MGLIGTKMSIFRKVVNYLHDDRFTIFWKTHYEIHGDVSLDSRWDL